MCSAYLWTFFPNLHSKYVYINTPDLLAQEIMINPTVHSSWLQFCSFPFRKYPAMCDDFVFSHGQIYRNVDSSTQNVDSSFQNVAKSTRKCWSIIHQTCRKKQKTPENVEFHPPEMWLLIHSKHGFWSTPQRRACFRRLLRLGRGPPGREDFPLWVVTHPQMLWMTLGFSTSKFFLLDESILKAYCLFKFLHVLLDEWSDKHVSIYIYIHINHQDSLPGDDFLQLVISYSHWGFWRISYSPHGDWHGAGWWGLTIKNIGHVAINMWTDVSEPRGITCIITINQLVSCSIIKHKHI